METPSVKNQIEGVVTESQIQNITDPEITGHSSLGSFFPGNVDSSRRDIYSVAGVSLTGKINSIVPRTGADIQNRPGFHLSGSDKFYQVCGRSFFLPWQTGDEVCFINLLPAGSGLFLGFDFSVFHSDIGIFSTPFRTVFWLDGIQISSSELGSSFLYFSPISAK